MAECPVGTESLPTTPSDCPIHCYGQVLVIHDMLGMFEKFVPKFVKRYANLNDQTRSAVKQYVKEVRESAFPGEEHSF